MHFKTPFHIVWPQFTGLVGVRRIQVLQVDGPWLQVEPVDEYGDIAGDWFWISAYAVTALVPMKPRQKPKQRKRARGRR